MQISFAKLYRMMPHRGRIYERRADVIFTGVLVLAGFLALLLTLDGYSFYITRFQERTLDIPFRRNVPLTTEEIGEVLKLLDTRQQSAQAFLIEEEQ